MLGKIKKHGVKILVFAINLLLMAVAVFAIENKDQKKRTANAENGLREENADLKGELQSLKGVIREISTEPKNGDDSAVPETASPSQTDSDIPSPSPPPVPSNPPAQKNTNRPSKSSNPPPSNAKTKTS